MNLCGIAVADPSSLAYMRRERGLAFPLLADPDGSALSRWQMADQNGLVPATDPPSRRLPPGAAAGCRIPGVSMLR